MLFPRDVIISKYIKKLAIILSFNENIIHFKKGSGSLKNIFYFILRLGEKRIFFFVKFSDNLFALNQRDISLSSQLISEKRSSTSTSERNKLVSLANMAGFTFSKHLLRSFR